MSRGRLSPARQRTERARAKQWKIYHEAKNRPMEEKQEQWRQIKQRNPVLAQLLLELAREFGNAFALTKLKIKGESLDGEEGSKKEVAA